MATIDEVIDQEEAVIGEIEELTFAIRELGGYISSLSNMAENLVPSWNGDQRLSEHDIEGGLSDIEMTVNDFEYDVRELDTYINRIQNALEELGAIADDIEDEDETEEEAA